MVVYITKWALSHGIIKRDAIEHKHDDYSFPSRYVYELLEPVKISTRSYRRMHRADICLTKEAAINKANEMRQKQIVYLEKKLEMLKSGKFE